MRVAVLSDIHANLPAFEAVLATSTTPASTSAGASATWSATAPSPDDCVELARERCDACLVGNHDLAVLGALDTSTFSSAAAAAVEWTAEHASKATLEFLAGLEPSDTSRAAALYHASPRDPGLGVRALARPGGRLPGGPGAAGQLHRPLARRAVLLRPGGRERAGPREARGWQAGAGTRLEIGEGRWLINPGSVGQPRDGDPRAAWLELDTDAWEATYHRVELRHRARGRRDRGGGAARAPRHAGCSWADEAAATLAAAMSPADVRSPPCLSLSRRCFARARMRLRRASASVADRRTPQRSDARARRDRRAPRRGGLHRQQHSADPARRHDRAGERLGRHQRDRQERSRGAPQRARREDRGRVRRGRGAIQLDHDHHGGRGNRPARPPPKRTRPRAQRPTRTRLRAHHRRGDHHPAGAGAAAPARPRASRHDSLRRRRRVRRSRPGGFEDGRVAP